MHMHPLLLDYPKSISQCRLLVLAGVEVYSEVVEAASQQSETKLLSMAREIFDKIDVDGSGTLDRDEVSALSIQMGRELRSLELDAAMAEMDQIGDGTVDFEEFRVWFKNMMDGDTMVRELFEAADKDESGVIDRDELRGGFSRLLCV